MVALTSNSMLMMERSLDYLWAKQAAHLDNIANAETPGYRVKTVRFEETFERMIRDAALRARSWSGYGSAGTGSMVRQAIQSTSWRVDEDDEQTRMDENGVNVIEQQLEAVRTAYQLQSAMRAVSSYLTTLDHAITG